MLLVSIQTHHMPEFTIFTAASSLFTYALIMFNTVISYVLRPASVPLLLPPFRTTTFSLCGLFVSVLTFTLSYTVPLCLA